MQPNGLGYVIWDGDNRMQTNERLVNCVTANVGETCERMSVDWGRQADNGLENVVLGRRDFRLLLYPVAIRCHVVQNCEVDAIQALRGR